MALNHKLSRSLSIGGVTIGGTVQTIATDLAQVVSATVIGSDQEVDVAIDVSAVRVAAIEADHDCTVEINTTSGVALELTANVPLVWSYTDSEDLFLGASDITKLYITTSGSLSTTVKLGVGVDATP